MTYIAAMMLACALVGVCIIALTVVSNRRGWGRHDDAGYVFGAMFLFLAVLWSIGLWT